jgi:hypothetical protein
VRTHFCGSKCYSPPLSSGVTDLSVTFDLDGDVFRDVYLSVFESGAAMAFRVKDLMISDLSAAFDKAGGHTECKECTRVSRCWQNSGCGFVSFVGCGHESRIVDWCLLPSLIALPLTPCPPNTIVGPLTFQPGGDPASALEHLAALKAQLKEALAEIEREQEALESSQKPKTVDEVENLQYKMRQAMEELENLKKELRDKHQE